MIILTYEQAHTGLYFSNSSVFHVCRKAVKLLITRLPVIYRNQTSALPVHIVL